MAFGNHVQADVSIYSGVDANPMTCRLWYALAGDPPVIGSLDTYTDELMEFIQAEWAAVLTDATTVGPMRTRWQIGTDEHFAWSSGGGTEGTVTSSEILPETSAVIVRKYTGDNAPNRRGRIFLPLIPETFQTLGRLTTPAATAYQALITALKSEVTGDTLDGDGVVLSPVQPNHKDQTLHAVTSWALVIDVHTRRDRQAPKKSLVQALLDLTAGSTVGKVAPVKTGDRLGFAALATDGRIGYKTSQPHGPSPGVLWSQRQREEARRPTPTVGPLRLHDAFA